MKPVLKFLLDRPGAVQEHFFSAPKASKSAPRATQEAFGSHRAAELQSDAVLHRFRPPKSSPGTSKINKIHRKTILFEEIVFRAQVASWTRFWTLLGSILGAFWPPRWVKSLLELLLERPRANQEDFFSVLEPSKSAPRGLQDRSKRRP